MRSALAFQLVIVPSSVFERMASLDASTTAARCRSLSAWPGSPAPGLDSSRPTPCVPSLEAAVRPLAREATRRPPVRTRCVWMPCPGYRRRVHDGLERRRTVRRYLTLFLGLALPVALLA